MTVFSTNGVLFSTNGVVFDVVGAVEPEFWEVYVDVTASTEVYIYLETPTSMQIDWGEGGGWETHNNSVSGARSHTYSSTGTYTIKLKGSCSGLDFTLQAGITPTYITGCSTIGGITGPSLYLGYLFTYATSLTTVPNDLFHWIANKITSLDYAFYESGLTNVPSFAGCSSLTTVGGLFYSCPITSLPENIFEDCPIIDMSSAFYGTRLTGELPATVFKRATSENLSISMTFGNINYGDGITIPENFFSELTGNVIVYGVFNSSKLTSVPSTIFDDVTANITNMGYAFYGTQAASYPDLTASCFANCTNTRSCFNDCSNASGPVPKMTNMTLCTDATSYVTGSPFTSIPSDAFDGCTSLEYVGNMFKNLTSLTGNSYQFWNWADQPDAKAECYQNCTNLTDYASIPAAYK